VGSQAIEVGGLGVSTSVVGTLGQAAESVCGVTVPGAARIAGAALVIMWSALQNYWKLP